jgi:hypothetical protein
MDNIEVIHQLHTTWGVSQSFHVVLGYEPISEPSLPPRPDWSRTLSIPSTYLTHHVSYSLLSRIFLSGSGWIFFIVNKLCYFKPH